MKKLNVLPMLILFATVGFLSSCSDDDAPEAENEEEIITDVVLTFTPDGDGAPVIASAQDPDGEGPEDLEIVSNITLAAGTTYTLAIKLENSIEVESITEEVAEEADEHMFFFGWTAGLFADPSGDGNLDSRDDQVIYNDFDSDQLPVGLETEWTTGDAASGTFRLILKHQPNIKTETSSSTDGESDLDLTWEIVIE